MLLVLSLRAQSTLYWDRNGTTSGAGSTPTGTWSAAASNWNTSFWGTSSTTSWTTGSNAVFSAGFDATNAYTVTVSGTQNLSGLTVSMGSPTFTGGTLNFNDSSPDLWTIAGSSATINSGIAGSNGLVKSGSGTLTLGGTAKSYTGTTAVNGGTLQLDANNILVNSTALSVAANATFALNWGISETVGALSGAGTVNLRTGSLTVGDASNTTFSGVVEDSYGTLVKAGSGTLTLSGNNTYTGVTTINAGTIVAASDTALGASTSGNTIASGAALHLKDDITLTEGQFSLTGTGTGGTGALRNLSGNNRIDAMLELAGNTTVNADTGSLTAGGQINLGSNTLTVTGAGNTTLSGAITSNGGITKSGTGSLTLGGTADNSFSGTLALNDGTVALVKTAGTNAVGGSTVNIGDNSGTAGSAVLRLDASNQIADYAGLITLNSDGALQLNNFTENINTLAGTGLIDLSTSGFLGVGVNSGSSTFGGDITGSGTFAKLGYGNLTLTDDINFDGTFQLAGGTLILSSLTLSADTLLVSANSIIDFGGAASILDFTNLAIADGVTLTIQNWTDATDFFYAQNWTGASFSVSGTAPMNQVVFSGFSGNDTKWQSYDRQITPVPEPSTYGALLIGGLAAVSALRRRLQRKC